MDRVVVVGLSLAALRGVEALRRGGYEGRIVAVSAEARVPYDRPPLSKQLLAGEWEPDQTVLRKQGLDDLDLDLHAPARAVHLDLKGGAVVLDDESRLDYDGCIIATGASPRRLPDQPTLRGLHTLRTLEDAIAIRAQLDARPDRVVVVGAGFIGAEVAATCRQRGHAVTVLEALEQPMIRGLGAELGAVCAQLHREHGVDLRLGVTVEAIEGDGRVERVRTSDGKTIDTDLVVVGIGVTPNTSWLEDSGLTIDDGVVCDETCLAAPGVVAAGDVCRWPNPRFGGASMRLEHWTNAAEQGVYAAERLVASDPVEPFAPVPFVWSDQYDTKIQTVGVFDADDEMHVVHGALEELRFVAVFGRDGRLTGALGFSSPRQVMQYRRLIAEGADLADALSGAEPG